MTIAALRDELANMREDNLRAALPDFCAMALGVKVENPHPAAQLLRNTGSSIGEFAGALVDPGIANRTQISTRDIEAALQTGDLGRALESAIEQKAQTASSNWMDGVRKITRRVPMPNHLPANMPTTDTGEFSPDPEGGEVEQIHQTFNGEPIKVSRSSKNLVISREALLEGDQMDMLGVTFDSIGQASGRAVMRSIAQMLMANAYLSDLVPWFDLSFNNLATTPGAVSVQTLSAAYTLLMQQQTLNSQANPDVSYATGVRGKTLIVPPDEYVQATTVISAMAFSTGSQLDVIALPELSGSWYLVGNANNASIALATLDGDDPLNVTRMPLDSTPNDQDGIFYRVRNEFGVAPIGRNIIRTDLA